MVCSRACLVLQGDKIGIQVARKAGQLVGVIEVATPAMDLKRGAIPPPGGEQKRFLGGHSIWSGSETRGPGMAYWPHWCKS